MERKYGETFVERGKMIRQKRREFLNLGGAAALAGICAPSILSASEKRKPNIIFILCDDMGWSDLGCYGGEIDTPNLDSLAQRGLRFTQAYNTSKCFPSRACLLTGVYAQQCGMDKRHGKIKNAVTLGEVLRTAGYRTLASGKHHGTENLYRRGFDHYYGLRDGCCNFWNPGVQRAGEPKLARKGNRHRHWCDDDKDYHPFTPKDRDFYTTDAFTDKALQWLDEGETKQNPFFLYLAYTAPHYPMQAWPKDIAKYKGRYSKGYQAIQNERHKRQIEMGLIDPETTALSEKEPLRDWCELGDDVRRREERIMEIYAAMVARVDQNVGRLIAKLREQGRLDNTLIFFASDNGACANHCNAKFRSRKYEDLGKINSYEVRGKNWAIVQNTPMRKYKNWSEEGGICTPFIASWPGHMKNSGGICRQPIHFIDIMATAVDLAAADYPKQHHGERITPKQGVSIAPAFRGSDIRRSEPIFWQWKRGGAIRMGDMKAVFNNRKQHNWELYKIAEDRNEKHDLADEMPEQLKAMVKRWNAWYKSVTSRQGSVL